MKNKFSKTKIIILLLITLSVIFISFKVLDDDDDFNIAKNFEIYHSVVRDINLYYVDDVNLSSLIEESIKEFLNKLDPYTVYYPESEIENYTFMTTGAYGGIGAMISDNGEELIVREIYKNSPSQKSGLLTGDKIISINDNIVTKKNIFELKELIKGEPGSELNLKIKRYKQDNYIEIKVIREKIQIENVILSRRLNNNIGYIKLTSFKANSASEFETSLKKLNDSLKLEGLIIDLRDNPGGLLNEAVSIVNLFVEKGETVVTTKGKVKTWNTIFKTTKNAYLIDIPIVVLVNNSSASASEIVAGALQDLDRAVVIGDRTYGKGLVQITRDLAYNSKIKITTAKYYIPSGRCIQILDYSHRNPDGSVGIVPDSLISEFITKGGRKVYDGGGIIPDIKLEKNSNSLLLKNLIYKNIIFDFCTKYYFENINIKPNFDFKVSEALFTEFINYAITNKFTYKSNVCSNFENIINSAEKEGYSESEVVKIKNLKNEFSPNIKEELVKNKTEISNIIQSEIILRYYFFEQKLIFDLYNDNAVSQSETLLTDNIKYKKILNK